MGSILRLLLWQPYFNRTVERLKHHRQRYYDKNRIHAAGESKAFTEGAYNRGHPLLWRNFGAWHRADQTFHKDHRPEQRGYAKIIGARIASKAKELCSRLAAARLPPLKMLTILLSKLDTLPRPTPVRTNAKSGHTGLHHECQLRQQHDGFSLIQVQWYQAADKVHYQIVCRMGRQKQAANPVAESIP